MKVMRLGWLVILVMAGVSWRVSARSAMPPPADKGTPSHVIQLWNGHDLAGWKTCFTNTTVNLDDVWSAAGGVLRLSGKPTGYLRTERTYGNYHVHAEWRWPETRGDSGLLVHIGDGGGIWPRSVECQLKSGSAGELIGQGGVDFTAPVVDGKKRAKITTSSEKPVGEWNQMDVYCRGGTIEVLVNGARQNIINKVSVSEGAIGLQLEGFPIEFRNLWLEQH